MVRRLIDESRAILTRCKGDVKLVDDLRRDCSDFHVRQILSDTTEWAR